MTYHDRTRSPLLHLPRELRDKIWDYALEDLEVHIQASGYITTLRYPYRVRGQSGHDETPSGSWAIENVPNWLKASKTIFSEGLEIFEKRSVCTSVVAEGHLDENPMDKCNVRPKTSFLGLLMTRVRHMSLNLNVVTERFDYDEHYIQGDRLLLKIHNHARSDEEDRSNWMNKIKPRSLIPEDQKFKICDNLLPNLTTLHLRFHMRTLYNCSRADLIHFTARTLRPLGTDFKRVTISMPRYVASYRILKDNTPPPNVAAVYAMYPRIQQACMHLGRHMCRKLGPLRFREPQKYDGPAHDEYREYSVWRVSEHRWDDCEEFEELEASQHVKWYRQWDRMDEETSEWFGETEVVPGANPSEPVPLRTSRPVPLRHAGLKSWEVLLAHGEDEKLIIRRGKYNLDQIPRRGTQSWFCEDTNQLVWITNAEHDTMGYVQFGGQLDQQVVLLPPPSKPTRPDPFLVSCHFGRMPEHPGSPMLPQDENGEDVLQRRRREYAETRAKAALETSGKVAE